ncbi:Cellobiose dehydrogenase (acceptor) [Ascochyta rabiei]|uniref:Cellobiose dehydrogenase (acceptor) n=1 Tax=Didymella rabiei TaxID=5454 RepID=UPI00220E2DB6|nr:Cellobiose dehydrogenase (acceptor) [Ascochyta rabiei]UPX11945.1 Cellobiose dehydrogenase (acceptor) [Ascochyta rabiei]
MSSPRILFNSGIGPSDQISIVESGSTRVTLPPKSEWGESPVGFVRDHTILILSFNVPGGTSILNQTELRSPSEEILDLYAHGSGPLAQSWNRLTSYTTVTNDDGHTTFVQIDTVALANNTVTFLVAITHNSTSTGTLGITSEGKTEWMKNPHLQTDSDKEAIIKAVDELLAISRLPNSTLVYSGPANSTGASVLEYALSAKDPMTVVIGGQHMIGTTIMGTDDGTKNGTSVVDTNCKVYGTGNLRLYITTE